MAYCDFSMARPMVKAETISALLHFCFWKFQADFCECQYWHELVLLESQRLMEMAYISSISHHKSWDAHYASPWQHVPVLSILISMKHIKNQITVQMLATCWQFPSWPWAIFCSMIHLYVVFFISFWRPKMFLPNQTGLLCLWLMWKLWMSMRLITEEDQSWVWCGWTGLSLFHQPGIKLLSMPWLKDFGIVIRVKSLTSPKSPLTKSKLYVFAN